MIEEGRRSRHMFSYVRKFRNDAREFGVPIAAHEALKRARVNVHIEGSTAAWQDPNVGVLFLGDHKKGFEQAILASAFGEVGRSDLHFLGLPFSISKRAADYLAGKDRELLLPVLPSYLAIKERTETTDKPRLGLTLKQRASRRLFGGSYTKEQLQAENNKTLSHASDLLRRGDAVAIMPTGAVSKGIDGHWHTGAARILASLDQTARGKIIIAPFSCDDNFSPVRLGINMATRAGGIRPLKERNFTIKFGNDQKTVLDIIGRATDPVEITAQLKEYYFQNLAILQEPKIRRRRR